MTGKSDENGTDAADWAARMHARLVQEVEAMVEALPEKRPDAVTDDVTLERRARTITSIARSVKTVAAIMERPRSRARAEAEDGMNEKDIDDIDPAELVRIRTELESELEHVSGLLEQKRLAGWAGSGTNPGGEPAALGPALAPDSAAGR